MLIRIVTSRITTPKRPRTGWSKIIPEIAIRPLKQVTPKVTSSAREGSYDVDHLFIQICTDNLRHEMICCNGANSLAAPIRFKPRINTDTHGCRRTEPAQARNSRCHPSLSIANLASWLAKHQRTHIPLMDLTILSASC